MQVTPINSSDVFFSVFIFHSFKWCGQERVWLVSVETKNTLPTFKDGFAGKMIDARDRHGLFALESLLSEGKNFLRWHKAPITAPTAWFKCYTGDPVKAAVISTVQWWEMNYLTSWLVVPLNLQLSVQLGLVCCASHWELMSWKMGFVVSPLGCDHNTGLIFLCLVTWSSALFLE